jgi:hypothetical protein
MTDIVLEEDEEYVFEIVGQKSVTAAFMCRRR